VTNYQISAINSYWEKCDEKYLGQTDRGKTVYPPPPLGSGGINMYTEKYLIELFNDHDYKVCDEIDFDNILFDLALW
jgi:hypothetical protein